MIKRTILISNAHHVSGQNEQLIFLDKETEAKKTVPAEDLGFLVLEHPQTTITQHAINLMAIAKTAVIFCDQKFMPSSMLLHFTGHQTQTERIRMQASLKETTRKKIWQQIIKAKIINQQKALLLAGNSDNGLKYMARNVQSGDTGNMEGRAAAYYWPRFFGSTFRRDPEGDIPNHCLNYGYAILRSAVARSLCGSGLHPTLGIFHRNKYNAFCLADDIMEAYRPFVDCIVLTMIQNSHIPVLLSTEEKSRLLEILSIDVQIGEKIRPMMIALSETTASLVKVMAGEKEKVSIGLLP